MSDTDWFLRRASEGKCETKFVEFKAYLNHTQTGDCCEIVKDIVAMANIGGGVIVIGVNNDGSRSAFGIDHLATLDSSHLANLVHKYTASNFADIEVHQIARRGEAVFAIRIGASDTPLVFSQAGTYPDPDDPKRQKTAFGKGTVFFRHGAKSEPGTTEDIRAFLDRSLQRIRKEWLGGVRKVVTAPSGSQVKVLPPEVFTTTSPAATPIRLTDDPKAPAYRVVNVDDSYPFRQKELVVELKKRLPAGTAFGPFDVQVIRRLHGADNKAFFHSPKFGSPQYSQAFVDWIVSQHQKNPLFFTANRDELTKRLSA